MQFNPSLEYNNRKAVVTPKNQPGATKKEFSLM